MQLVNKLFSFYRFDEHVKTEDQKKEFINFYALELCKRNIPNPEAVFSNIVNNYKYKTIPTIEFISKAIAQTESVEDQNKRNTKRDDDHQRQYLEFYQRRCKNREDIYHANTDRIENIIAKGWGMDLACALSYCAEKADKHGRMDSLIHGVKQRAHYSPPITKGQDPLFYFENMPINQRNLKINLKHPVEFVEGVMS